eukprot:8540877-Pyramimonas_sp.AAC.1
MHTSDLGVLPSLIGGAMWELMYDGPFHGTEKQRCAELWVMIKKWYDLLGTPSRLTTFSVALFKHP